MIAFLSGKVAHKAADALAVDVGGVGYWVRVTPQTLGRAGQAGDAVFLHTSLIVREDAMELFGFLSREDLRMFERLTSISGVGPRTALGLLSALSAGDIAIAVATGDAKALAKAPGIGPKTAQRMILEMKDRITDDDLAGSGIAAASAEDLPGDAGQEAILGLLALGYTGAEAAKAIAAVRDEANEPEQLLRLALRRLGGG